MSGNPRPTNSPTIMKADNANMGLLNALALLAGLT